MLLLLAAVPAATTVRPAALFFCAASGFLAAAPVLAWALALAHLPAPELPFAVATAGANIWTWLSGLLTDGKWGGPATATAASLGLVAGTLVLDPSREGQQAAPVQSPARTAPPYGLGTLLLFGLVAYPAGGFLYRLILPALTGPAVSWVGYWPYVAALAVAPLARRRLELLSAMSLGAIGLFLLAATIPTLAGSVAAVWVVYVGLLAGLAWADLFFWLSLVRRASAGTPADLGWGLGINVLVLWATSTLAANGHLEHLLHLPGLPAAAIPTAAVLIVAAPLLALHLGRSSHPVVGAGVPDTDRIAARLKSYRSLLTATEQKVLELILDGHSSEEIAQTLVISPHTVKFHIRNILRKTGFRSRKELRRALLGAALIQPAMVQRDAETAVTD